MCVTETLEAWYNNRLILSLITVITILLKIGHAASRQFGNRNYLQLNNLPPLPAINHFEWYTCAGCCEIVTTPFGKGYRTAYVCYTCLSICYLRVSENLITNTDTYAYNDITFFDRFYNSEFSNGPLVNEFIDNEMN